MDAKQPTTTGAQTVPLLTSRRPALAIQHAHSAGRFARAIRAILECDTMCSRWIMRNPLGHTYPSPHNRILLAILVISCYSSATSRLSVHPIKRHGSRKEDVMNQLYNLQVISSSCVYITCC